MRKAGLELMLGFIRSCCSALVNQKMKLIKDQLKVGALHVLPKPTPPTLEALIKFVGSTGSGKGDGMKRLHDTEF